MDKKTLDKLKYLINKKKSVEEICDALNIEVKELYEMVLCLKNQGENYDIIDNVPQRMKPITKVSLNPLSHLSISEVCSSVPITPNLIFKFCLLSDVHYGSLYDRPDIMREIYAECERRKIKYIFCCGDLTNGNYMNRPSFNETSRVYKSIDMVDYVANVHPESRDIKFYTIAGNHDTSYLCTEGIDIIAKISELRPDIIYLGQDLADVTLGPVKMRMYHGYDNKKLQMENRLIRLYDKMEQICRPDILQIGHIHHSHYMLVDSTHIFQTASLMDKMPGECKNKHCEISCWFVSIDYDEQGKIQKVIPEIKDFSLSRKRRK